MEHQECTKCHNEYPLTKEYFYARNDRPKGFVSQCKKCSNKRGEKHRKKYRESNRSKIREINKAYRESHKDEIKEYSKNYRLNHKDEIKEINSRHSKTPARKKYLKQYYVDNQDAIKEYSVRYRKSNRKAINAYFRNKRANDLQYRIYKNMQSRIQSIMRHVGAKKSSNTVNLIGCSMSDFINYIESKFSDGMTWENYGREWHIDHIKPCASFNLSVPEEQSKCFRWDNLQPLWAKDNLSKNSRYKGKLIRKGGTNAITHN